MKENSKLYLPEDEDLLRKLEEINPSWTGAKQEQGLMELNILQIKALLRSRNSTERLNSSTDVFSRILICFAVLQTTLAFFQILLPFTPKELTPWLLIIILIMIAVAIYMIFSFFKKNEENL